MKIRIGTIILLALLSLSCTWVKLIPGAEEVQVLAAAEVENCESLGRTTVSLKAKIAGVNRNQKQVQFELETLGRNAALNLNGDTIVVDSEVSEGQQAFKIYRCRSEEKSA